MSTEKPDPEKQLTESLENLANAEPASPAEVKDAEAPALLNSGAYEVQGSSAEELVFGQQQVRGGLDIYVEGLDSFDHEHGFHHGRSQTRNSHWSIAWSDLMMTMFVLFMVMFVYKTADREFLSGEGIGSFSGTEIGRQVEEQGMGGSNDFHEFGKKAYSKIFDFSKLTIEEDFQEFAEIRLAPDNTVRIILTGDLLFPLGQKEMNFAGLGLLEKISHFLRDTPYKINVVGHTDNIPMKSDAAPGNWELSTDRAIAVAQYLIDKTHLPARQFYVTGHAEYRPVVPNDSPINRAKNRRVEIVVTKELPGALPMGAADL